MVNTKSVMNEQIMVKLDITVQSLVRHLEVEEIHVEMEYYNTEKYVIKEELVEKYL